MIDAIIHTKKYKLFKSIPTYVLVGMLVYGCENDLKEVERVTSHEELPLQTVLNSEIVYSSNGKPSLRIEAGRIDHYADEEDPRDEFSNGLHIISFDNDGEMESEITADRATNYTKRKVMVAKDSVVLKNNEGKTLNTELLTWDENTNKIYTDKFVKITTPTEILFGDGLEAEQDFSKYEIKNIKGRIKIDEDENSDTLQIQPTNSSSPTPRSS